MSFIKSNVNQLQENQQLCLFPALDVINIDEQLTVRCPCMRCVWQRVVDSAGLAHSRRSTQLQTRTALLRAATSRLNRLTRLPLTLHSSSLINSI